MDDPHISRLTPTRILEGFTGLPGMTIRHARARCKKATTKWFEQALGMYEKEDLDTLELKIMLWHSRSFLSELKERLSCRSHIHYA